MRRVVITGIGAVTPLGADISSSWKNLIDGRSGVRKVTSIDLSDIPTKIAGMVPKVGDETKFSFETSFFDAEKYINKKDLRKMDEFIVYGMSASIQAIEDSGWIPESREDKENTGVLIGSGIGGLAEIERTTVKLYEKGFKKVSPFFIPASLINLTSGHVSIKYGFQGPNHSVVTACATGGHAIGDAMRLIQHGDAEVMVAGSCEATVCRDAIAGFNACRALSTSFNDSPEEASRPWDEKRDGFVMGEGAGTVVLEEYEHAKKRGAKIYAEIIGYGLSGDAHHITAPAEDGRGAYLAMKRALNSAKISPDKIDYINAHGTSTPLGDLVEVNAVKNIFGSHAKSLSMSSTKSSIGHLLGGAGSVEGIFSCLAMRDNVAPPTLNLENPSEGCDLDFVANHYKEKKIDYAISNSFGFGGTNVSLVFKKI